MDFLGFTLSVWAAIAIGVFFLAMVLGCIADRHHVEEPKWFVVAVGLVVFFIWQWGDLTLQPLTTVAFWKAVAIYLGIGLAYSGLEFYCYLRNSVRQWGLAWERFKQHEAREIDEEKNPMLASSRRDDFLRRKKMRDDTPVQDRFLNHWSAPRISIIQMTIENGEITPTVERGELAQGIACWTLFWPAYALSLLLGNLMTEVWRKVADLFTLLSRAFVKRAFAGVFR